MVTTGAIRHQSSSQIGITNKPTPRVLQAGCPSCHPTNSVKALNGKKSHYCTTHHISGTLLLLLLIIIMVLSQQHKLVQRPSIHVNLATRRPSIYKSFVFRLVFKCLTYYCASSAAENHLAVFVTCVHSHNDNICLKAMFLDNHGRRKRGYAGDLTPPTIYVVGDIDMYIPPLLPPLQN